MNRLPHTSASIVIAWMLAAVVPKAWAQQYPFLSVPGSPKAINNLFQDSRGRLWLGGLESACFDGTRFYPLRDYGLPAVPTYTFSEDSSGAIWIGADSGVYRFADGRIQEIGKGLAPSVIAVTPNLAVAALATSGRSALANASLVRFRRTGERWAAETVMSLDAPGSITLDPSGMLLYPTPDKGWNEIRLEDVVRWRAGVAVPVIRHPVKNFPGNGPMKVMRDHSGCLWVGVTGGTYYDCGHGAHDMPWRTENVMREGADGTMTVWDYNRLAVGRPGAFRKATRANGLPGLVHAITAADGTVWLATTDGLYRFASPFRLEYWTVREGLSEVPWSITRSGSQIYAGLETRVVTLSKDRLRWETVASFGRTGVVAGLLGGDDGTLLASLMGVGVVQMSAQGRVIARTSKDDVRLGMRSVKTAEGDIWTGDGRLGRLKRSGKVLQLEEHRLNAKPAGNLLSIKYEEHTRKLWSCYNGGLVVRDEQGSWREFTTRDGLLTNGCWSLAPLPNGDVWYAYFNLRAHALIRPAAGGGITVRQYRTDDGVPEPGSDTMDADQRGWLWRGGELGIYVANAAEAESGQWLQINRSDGFPANDMNTGSVFVDPDGSLWWGADNDLAHYTPPADLVAPRWAPQVFVSAFSVDGAAPRMAEAAKPLPHGSKITAHIGSLQFERRNGLVLRYRILPEETEWRETHNLDLALGPLWAGAHILEVQGRVFTGPWSGTVRGQFHVLRPAGLTWPWLAGYFLVALSLAAGGFLWRRRQLAVEAALLPDLAAWRMGALLPEVHALEGTLLDARFEVGGLLARGGFANVLAGYDREQGQRCAIKVFRSEVKDQEWVERRFKQEVTALQKVQHPNVVSIYANGTAQSGAPYLVMEFVEGRSLREVLEPGPLPPRRAGHLLQQLASALDTIHALGICHRDVKPENIIVRQEGADEEAVLIDFSIAIVQDANETMHGLSRAAGSFDYMAPEQAVGYAEPSSDIYSLAKLLLEMLTGRQLKDLFPDAALDLPRKVREFAAGPDMRFSAESIEMLASALEFDPARRPRVAGTFAAPLVKDLEQDAGLWLAASF